MSDIHEKQIESYSYVTTVFGMENITSKLQNKSLTKIAAKHQTNYTMHAMRPYEMLL